MKTIAIQGAGTVTEEVVIRVTLCPEPRDRMPYEDEERAARELGRVLAEALPAWVLKESLCEMLDAIEQGCWTARDAKRAVEINRVASLIRGDLS